LFLFLPDFSFACAALSFSGPAERKADTETAATSVPFAVYYYRGFLYRRQAFICFLPAGYSFQSCLYLFLDLTVRRSSQVRAVKVPTGREKMMKNSKMFRLAILLTVLLFCADIPDTDNSHVFADSTAKSGLFTISIVPQDSDSKQETMDPSQEPDTSSDNMTEGAAAEQKTGVPAFAWNRGGYYTGEIQIREVIAPGILVEESEIAAIDYSCAADGYIMVKKYIDTTVKVWIDGPNGKSATRYRLPEKGVYYPIPLQFGSGEYRIMVMLQTGGENVYTTALDIRLTVTVENEGYTLLPGLYVNYNSSSAAVRKSFDLCLNATSDLEKVQSIYGFITETIKYDDTYGAGEKASSEYIPDPDAVLRGGSGTCFDYASLMAVMLRAQGIKTRMIFGYANDDFHAWNEVYIEQEGWISEGVESTGGWILLDATYGAAAGSGTSIEVVYKQKEIY